MTKYAVGDINSDAKGSGARANQGKPKWELFPLHLMEDVVRVWEHGEIEYSSFNWAKGMAWSIPYACIMRHLIAWWWRGEELDPDSGYSHLAHVVANVMMLMHYRSFYNEGDNRPLKWFKG